MQKYIRLTPVVITVLSLGISGCSLLRTQEDQSAESSSTESGDSATAAESGKDPKDQKIETLTSALSRAQSRLEELDAKVSALTDKVDSTRMTVDNITGTGKPLKTEAVGSAAAEAPVTAEPKHSEPEKAFSKSDAAVGEFNKAMSLYKSGKYSDAVLAFNQFTETFPEHILAGSAQFYAGESYYFMGEFKLAINEYAKVVSSFSSSPRVASAMVRTAHCYEALGNKAESSRTMALARDLFENNPSLEWSNNAQPSLNPNKDHGKNLDSAPIEPKQHAQATNQDSDDKEIDSIN